MVDFEKQFQTPQYASRQTAVAKTFKLVYGWMGAGLALSGATAWFVFSSGLWQKIFLGPWFYLCVIAEIALVFSLGASIRKLSAFAALAMFLGYAVLNGLTLSVIFVVYKLALIQNIFFITAGMFAGLAVWGSLTKSDLSSIGSICGMAVWGLVVALFVNMFVGSSSLDWFISFAAILIFTGLTMYDAQKIKQIAATEATIDRDSLMKAGIVGALSLYLDFINLFLNLLRIFGRER